MSSTTFEKTRKKETLSREEVKGDGEQVKGDNYHKKEVQDVEIEKKKIEVQTSTPTKKRTTTWEG